MWGSFRNNKTILQGRSGRQTAFFKSPVLDKLSIETAFAAMTDFFKKDPMQGGRDGATGFVNVNGYGYLVLRRQAGKRIQADTPYKYFFPHQYTLFYYPFMNAGGAFFRQLDFQLQRCGRHGLEFYGIEFVFGNF